LGNIDSSHGNSVLNAFFAKDKEREKVGSNEKVALLSKQKFYDMQNHNTIDQGGPSAVGPRGMVVNLAG